MASLATAGGGVQMKLPLQKHLEYHSLGVKRIIPSSFGHHILIQLSRPKFLSTADDNIFSPYMNTSVGQLLDNASIPHAFILSPEIWNKFDIKSPCIWSFLILKTNPNNILDVEVPLW